MPDPTREELEAIIARAEAATEGPLDACEVSNGNGPWHIAIGQAGSAVRHMHLMGCVKPSIEADTAFYCHSRADVLALCSLVLRQMDEIEKLRAETVEAQRREGAAWQARDAVARDRDHWRGVVVEVQSDAAVAESNCDALTADLAAARELATLIEATDG